MVNIVNIFTLYTISINKYINTKGEIASLGKMKYPKGNPGICHRMSDKH